MPPEVWAALIAVAGSLLVALVTLRRPGARLERLIDLAAKMPPGPAKRRLEELAARETARFSTSAISQPRGLLPSFVLVAGIGYFTVLTALFLNAETGRGLGLFIAEKIAGERGVNPALTDTQALVAALADTLLNGLFWVGVAGLVLGLLAVQADRSFYKRMLRDHADPAPTKPEPRIPAKVEGPVVKDVAVFLLLLAVRVTIGRLLRRR